MSGHMEACGSAEDRRSVGKELFENHQRELELAVEMLAHELELDVTRLLTDVDGQHRTGLQNKTSLLDQRLQAVYKEVRDNILGGDSKRCSSFQKPRLPNPAPYHLNTKEMLAVLKEHW